MPGKTRRTYRTWSSQGEVACVSAQTISASTSTAEEGFTRSLPNILLLADVPPCKGHAGTLNLLQLCDLLPYEKLRGFFIVNPDIGITIDAKYQSLPQKVLRKPRERQPRSLPGALGSLQCFVQECHTELRTVPRLAKDLEEFMQRHDCELVWCVIQGQTMIRIAREIQLRTRLPMVTQVWDPPEWWLRENMVDGWSQQRVLSTFAEVIRDSRACAAASWAMADDYCKLYQCNALPVIAGLDARLAKEPKESLNDSDTLIIGCAGQIYALAEWDSLIATLDAVKWRIEGRRVIVRVLGPGNYFWSRTPRHVEFLGMREQAETIDILSTCDICYCPYWLNPVFEKEARHSFPSKLTSYLASGRPVLFHGPEYASPARFLKKHDAGLILSGSYKSEILNALERLVFDRERYLELTTNGSRAFHTYLTAAQMRGQFFRCLDLAVATGPST